MEPALTKAVRLVDESFDATNLARAKKARVAVLSVEPSDSRPTVDVDMPIGYQDALFETVDFDIEETERDKHRCVDIECLQRFDAFFLVDASSFEGDNNGLESPDRCCCHGTRAFTTGDGHQVGFFSMFRRTSLYQWIRLKCGKKRKLQLEETLSGCGE